MFDSEKHVLLIFAALVSMFHFTSFRCANFEIINNEPTKFYQKEKRIVPKEAKNPTENTDIANLHIESTNKAEIKNKLFRVES